MFTIYTIVKPFRGEFRSIQHNSINSWLQLHPQPQILTFGAGEWGAKAAAKRMDVPVYSVERNEHGTPLLNSAIDQAETMAQHDVCCYVNADIIILQDFMAALEQTMAQFDCFLLSARRWDTDLRGLDWNAIGGEAALREAVGERGELHRVTGGDVFCYRGLDWGTIPDFAVGRRLYDNWLVHRATELGVPFVDATAVATVIHQEHSTWDAERLDEPEWKHNRALYATDTGNWNTKGFSHATHKMTADGEFKETHFGRQVRNDKTRVRRQGKNE